MSYKPKIVSVKFTSVLKEDEDDTENIKGIFFTILKEYYKKQGINISNTNVKSKYLNQLVT